MPKRYSYPFNHSNVFRKLVHSVKWHLRWSHPISSPDSEDSNSVFRRFNSFDAMK